jgi:ketosteroid isomerase-like protein
MISSNDDLIRSAYDAFAMGDIPAVLRVLDAGITWHVPGRSPLSGDYKGHDGVLDFFGRCQQLSGGTLRVAADEIISEGDRVVALTTVSAERHGQSWSSPEVHVWQVRDGKAFDFREFQGDQQAEDAFWAS